jgi:hypothetical protein
MGDGRWEKKHETERKNNNVSLEHKAASDDTVPLLPIHLAVSQLITRVCVSVLLLYNSKLLWRPSFVLGWTLLDNDLMPYDVL